MQKIVLMVPGSGSFMLLVMTAQAFTRGGDVGSGWYFYAHLTLGLLTLTGLVLSLPGVHWTRASRITFWTCLGAMLVSLWSDWPAPLVLAGTVASAVVASFSLWSVGESHVQSAHPDNVHDRDEVTRLFR